MNKKAEVKNEKETQVEKVECPLCDFETKDYEKVKKHIHKEHEGCYLDIN
jgi:hypothetical protein